MNNAGSILEPACLYADQGQNDIRELVRVVKRYGCRSAVVHPVDLGDLFDLPINQQAVVIDFPYGKGTPFQRCVFAGRIFESGVYKVDVCVNLAHVLSGDFGLIARDFCELRSAAKDNDIVTPEIKAIIQLPYLWQYAPERIEPLVAKLADAGVKVIKDWTTVHNFSKPVDVSKEKRLEYLNHLKDIIVRLNLMLKIKIAGGVRKENARAFINGGADILGVGVQFVPDVIKALESPE